MPSTRPKFACLMYGQKPRREALLQNAIRGATRDARDEQRRQSKRDEELIISSRGGLRQTHRPGALRDSDIKIKVKRTRGGHTAGRVIQAVRPSASTASDANTAPQSLEKKLTMALEDVSGPNTGAGKTKKQHPAQTLNLGMGDESSNGFRGGRGRGRGHGRGVGRGRGFGVPRPCHYGTQCTNRQCLFQHPPAWMRKSPTASQKKENDTSDEPILLGRQAYDLAEAEKKKKAEAAAAAAAEATDTATTGQGEEGSAVADGAQGSVAGFGGAPGIPVPCHYNVHCTNPFCRFQHPPSWVRPTAAPGGFRR